MGLLKITYHKNLGISVLWSFVSDVGEYCTNLSDYNDIEYNYIICEMLM